MGAYLGIDLHRRRSLAVCLNAEGERLWWRRFENSPENLAGILEEAGPEPEVSSTASQHSMPSRLNGPDPSRITEVLVVRPLPTARPIWPGNPSRPSLGRSVLPTWMAGRPIRPSSA